jgi:hypothetical protein
MERKEGRIPSEVEPGDSTWEPLGNCSELTALDNYLTLMNVKNWKELPKG